MPLLVKKSLLVFLWFQFLLPEQLLAYSDPVATYLGIEQGLSNNSVTSIYQDHNGFMWLGTFDGLNRYDGYEFKIFRNQVGDTTSLPGNTIYAIEGDSSQNLWIGGRKGLSIYNYVNQSFTTARFKDGRTGPEVMVTVNINHLKAGPDGDVFAGTEQYGLLMFPGGSFRGQQVPLSHNPAAEWAYEVNYVEVHPNRQYMWVFVENEGLGLFDRKQNTVQIINTDLKKVNVLKTDPKGYLWMGTDNGLYRYDIAARTISGNYMPEPTRIVNISIDRQGTFWLASDGSGVFTLSGSNDKAKPLVAPGAKNILTSNAIFTVYLDKEDRKWIGMLRGGINIIEARQIPFSNFFSITDKVEEPSRNFINAFCETSGKNVWVGASGSGLKYWDRRLNSFTYYTHQPQDPSSISSNLVTYMARDHKGSTWVATWNGGINRINEPGRSFEHYSCLNPFTGAEEKNVWVLYEDSRKTLWASTTNNGTLYTLNRAKNKFELFDRRVVNVQSMAEDRRGDLWGGNYSSLIKLDRETKNHRVYEIGYPVRSIHEDRMGNFWVGTDGGGLLKFNRETGRYHRFTMNNGLPGNTVLRILEDAKGNLWLSTFTGLSRFDPRKNVFRNFSQADGLPSNQYNFNAALALSTGEFLFGGIRGFIVFHPDSVIDYQDMPTAYLTDIKISNVPIEKDDSYVSKRTGDRIEELRIPYHAAVVTLDYTTLEYRAPDNIRYAYYLEGWDKSWTDAGKLRTANYTRLNEGTYFFKMKHTNAAGRWSEEKTLVKLVVLPPWYRSWWAILLYLLVAGAAIGQYIRYTRSRTKKLEALVAERTKELQSSNEDLQRFAHVASHDLKEPVRKIKTFIGFLEESTKERLNEREKTFMAKVHNAANRMFVMIDGVLKYSTMNAQEQAYEEVDLNEVIKHVETDLEVAIHNKKAVIQYDRLPRVPGAPVLIHQLFYNLINNSLKFSKADTPPVITITSEIVKRQDKDWAFIVLSDNGIGFEQKYAEQIFGTFTRLNSKDKYEGTGLGLALCKKIVERHGGTISAKAREHEGASFEILLPLGK